VHVCQEAVNVMAMPVGVVVGINNAHAQFISFRMRAMILSSSRFSALARKLQDMRWRNTGKAISAMSWRLMAGRPSMAAMALAARIRAWPARGPAPQSIDSDTNLSFPFAVAGRVAWAISAAYSATSLATLIWSVRCWYSRI